MKTIKVLGTGCPSCQNTEKIVETVVEEMNIEAQIIKVTDIQEIMMYDILSTPAIVIDEKVVLKGKTPTKEEVKALLVDNFANNACCSDENLDSSCCTPEEKETGCC